MNKFAWNFYCETWHQSYFEVFSVLVTFNGGIFALGELNLLIFINILDCILLYYFWPRVSWLTLAYRKKINEVEVWASTEVKPSNEIEIHKAKKDSKFNFILISDCLADIHPTQKSQFNS